MSGSGAPRALAFGAHPDDVEIFHLGLLLTLQARGWEIGWVVATDGQAGLPPGAEPEMRRREALQAGVLVGVTPELLGLIDGGLNYGDEAASRVREALARFGPDVVITHSPNDYHADHRVLSRLVADVCPATVALVFSDTMLGVGFEPTLTVDVTAVYERKLEVLRIHRSQGVEPFEAGLRTWHRFRALQTGDRSIEYAEAYAPFETVANRRNLRRLQQALAPQPPA